MSYDHIWLCPSLKREEWIEARSSSRQSTSSDETLSDGMIQHELLAYRDHGQWKNAVRLSMGENLSIDEMYLFLNGKDARRFFQDGPLDPGEHGYHDREYIKEGAGPDGCDIGYGFDSVALWDQGELVTEHSGPALKGRIYSKPSRIPG
jgi:hypothetical protein